jgi:hypothetical protein
MIRLFTFFFLLTILFITVKVDGQTQQDTIYTYFSKDPVVIDGSDADACWAKASWHAMEQVWLGNAMNEGDFSGKFKTAWDKDYLYVLVQIEDDSLSDDHKDPLDNYWNDDAVELFIDEDRSKGDHLNNNNAFAYHCSIFYDVIDGAGKNGATINCKNNITMKMDTIGPHLYLWEFAVKMFNKNFDYSNPEASRVYLFPNKLMGFSIAYCDNDGASDKLRENFIGSVVMPTGHENDSYMNANYFGSMLLVDPDKTGISKTQLPVNEKRVKVFPNSAIDKITCYQKPGHDNNMKLEICSVTGTLIRAIQISGLQQTVEFGDLAKGVYLFNFSTDTYSQTERIVKN